MKLSDKLSDMIWIAQSIVDLTKGYNRLSNKSSDKALDYIDLIYDYQCEFNKYYGTSASTSTIMKFSKINNNSKFIDAYEWACAIGVRKLGLIL